MASVINDELQQDIDEYLAKHWEDVIADIDELVSIESVEDLDAACDGAPFGPGPRRALDKALEIASRMGLSAHDCEGYVGYADLPGRSNTQIGIIGHVDVVPAGTGWTFDPYKVTRRDGYLVGRGVIDDKGPIMVALHAVKFWADRGHAMPYTVRVLFGANEETNMKDIEYYRAHHDDPAFLFTPDNQFPVGYGESGICSGTLASPRFEGGCIVEFEGGQAVNAVPCDAFAVIRGEAPACADERISLEPCGPGLTKVKAKGVAAHASTPELGVNAIGLLVDYLIEAKVGSPDEKAFFQLMAKLFSYPDGSGLDVACSDEYFGALTTVGGVIRFEDDRILQSIDFRYPTTITSREIEDAVLRHAEKAGAAFSMEHDKTPFLMNPESGAVRALLDAYNDVTGENRTGMTSKGGTYARTFTTGVSFGVEKPWERNPDWVGGMHGPDEGVREDLLKQAFSIYARTLGNLMELSL